MSHLVLPVTAFLTKYMLCFAGNLDIKHELAVGIGKHVHRQAV